MLFFHKISPAKISKESLSKVPNYLLFDGGDNKQPKCAQMFTKIVPNLQQSNVTDKELIERLVGTSGPSNLNSAYLKVDINNDDAYSLHRGKYCSNQTQEMILFFISQIDPKLDDDSKVSLSSLKNLTNGLSCKDIDLRKCQRIEPDEGRLKLFEFDEQMMIKQRNWRNDQESTTLADIVYRFVRHSSHHYNPEGNKWVKSLFHAVNITFSQNWVRDNEISVNITISYRIQIFEHFSCRGFLQNTLDSKIELFLRETSLLFDQLQPSTSYNICVECSTTVPICTELKTTSKSLLSSYLSLAKGTRLNPKYFFIFMILIIIFIIVVVTSLKFKRNARQTNESFEMLVVQDSNLERQCPSDVNDNPLMKSSWLSIKTNDSVTSLPMDSESVEEPAKDDITSWRSLILSNSFIRL